MFGYIYIRENEWHNSKNIVKMGRTENLKNRDRDYLTGESERGKMSEVYNIKDFPIDLVEKILQEKLKQICRTEKISPFSGLNKPELILKIREKRKKMSIL